MALSPENHRQLEALYQKLKEESQTFVGYPCNLDFDYSELAPFFNCAINNVGDPFISSNYHVNTHEFEREVIEFFAELTHAGKDFWGYVTNGGTEGNMYGLYLARELYPQGIVFYSQDTHYSVTKMLRILNMRNIMIRSQDNGEIDYEDLKETLKIKRDFPPIIMANIGTTMKGAVDRVETIREILNELAISNAYIHCDAALGGMLLPFIDGAPRFDFAVGADSLSISGHKFVGSPTPCGIALAKKRNVDRIARSIEYVGTLDTTIMGSRNGLTPLFLWYAIHRVGKDGFRKKVEQCLEVADYAIEQLKKCGQHAWRNEYSTTVVFPCPPADMVRKWQLAPYKGIAHLVIMPHVKKERIDRFINDLIKEGKKS
ncbi:MAG: histidine decarboxylase [Candidatus Omnitrophica bacterium]|nr:histidine decarboxylase [Candidatus Omnitrophota bacterium]